MKTLTYESDGCLDYVTWTQNSIMASEFSHMVLHDTSDTGIWCKMVISVS